MIDLGTIFILRQDIGVRVCGWDQKIAIFLLYLMEMSLRRGWVVLKKPQNTLTQYKDGPLWQYVSFYFNSVYAHVIRLSHNRGLSKLSFKDWLSYCAIYLESEYCSLELLYIHTWKMNNKQIDQTYYGNKLIIVHNFWKRAIGNINTTVPFFYIYVIFRYLVTMVEKKYQQ